MRDHSMGGFWTACVLDGIAFFIVRDFPPGSGSYLGIYLVGLVGYFGYVAFMKTGRKEGEEESWTNSQVGTGFMVAAVAPIVIVPLFFVFGWIVEISIGQCC